MTKEKIQQLLASIGAASDKDDKNIETVDYNWRMSHYYNRFELKKIQEFAEEVAHNTAEKFSVFFHKNFSVELTSVSQHYASEFMTAEAKKDYFLAFGKSKQVLGLIDIPLLAALLWSTQLLGDTKIDVNSPRKLSQLEESLLSDIAANIIEAYSVSSSQELSACGEMVKGRMPLEIDEMRETCKIVLTVKQENPQQVTTISLLVFCDAIQSIAGKIANVEKIAQQDSAKTMMSHFMSMPLDVAVRLSSVKFNFQQVMDVRQGDIIVLDKNVSESADVIIDNRILLRGKPAKSNGKYSVVITELCNNKL